MAFTEWTFFWKTVRVLEASQSDSPVVSDRGIQWRDPSRGRVKYAGCPTNDGPVAGDILISRTGPDCVRRTQSVGRPTSRRHRVNAPAARICARRSAAHTGARARVLSRIVRYRRRVRAFFYFFFALRVPETDNKDPCIYTRVYGTHIIYTGVCRVLSTGGVTRRWLVPRVRPS